MSGGPALMISADQVGRLGFDTIGIVGDMQVGCELMSWAEAHLGSSGASFPSKKIAGGLLAPTAGAGIHTPSKDVRLYVQLDFGAGFTGTLLRPFLRTGAGFDVRLSEALTVGPVVGYDHVFQHARPNASTDARFFWAGASLTFRPAALRQAAAPAPAPVPPPVPPRVIVRTVSAPPPPPPAIAPSEHLLELMDRVLPKTEVETSLLAPVLFRVDSDELEPTGVAMLHEVAQTLEARPELELVEIEGYADLRGTPEHNLDLSQRRAQRVLDWLIEHGVAADRLRIAAHGATAPVEQGGAEVVHEQNRRVVFRVLRLRENSPGAAQEPP
jgi:outer membrane protein OmpA-like peptidoglycan-associated protein